VTRAACNRRRRKTHFPQSDLYDRTLLGAPGMLHSADHGSWSNLLELHASKSAGSHSLGERATASSSGGAGLTLSRPLTESGSPIMTRVRARPLFSCMEVMSMGWASSEISNVFFRYWKSSKRCSGRCLGERFRFPILPSKEGQAWSAH
jgi:hypothetical protein